MIDCLSRFIIHFGTNLGAIHTCLTYICKPNLATSLALHCNVNDVTFCAKLTEGPCL